MRKEGHTGSVPRRAAEQAIDAAVEKTGAVHADGLPREAAAVAPDDVRPFHEDLGITPRRGVHDATQWWVRRENRPGTLRDREQSRARVT
jgi:hypothetical protein